MNDSDNYLRNLSFPRDNHQMITEYDLPPLPPQLKHHLLEHAKRLYYNIDNAATLHQTYDLDDTEETASVSYFALNSAELMKYVAMFLNSVPALSKFRYFLLHTIHDGTQFDLHFDHCDSEIFRLHYVLDTGGDDVITHYWKVKEEYQGRYFYPVRTLPEYMFDKVQTLKLQEDHWYHLPMTKVHSVDNIESPRIVLIVRFWKEQDFKGKPIAL